ncbi:MAG: hypothetical protein AVDCRST_MAG83-547, partial [uncultured Arthrobacter sp.]
VSGSYSRHPPDEHRSPCPRGQFPGHMLPRVGLV